jgi:hypothetical protein
MAVLLANHSESHSSLHLSLDNFLIFLLMSKAGQRLLEQEEQRQREEEVVQGKV